MPHFIGIHLLNTQADETYWTKMSHGIASFTDTNLC